MRHVLLSLAVLGLAACNPAGKAPQSAQTEASVPKEASVPGLELTDAPGSVSLVDAGAQDAAPGAPHGFALHCETGPKLLRVSAAASQLGPYAKAGPGEFIASGARFPGVVAIDAAHPELVEMALPLTAELLASIATTSTARLVISDGFAESNPDTSLAFRDFAHQCAEESAIAVALPE